MVSVVLPSLDLSDAPPLHVAVGAFAATLLAYKLLFSQPAHERYARKHGLTNIRPAKRLPQTHFLLGDVPELSRNADRFIDWVYDKTLEMHEAPWLRRVPSLPESIVVSSPALIEDVVKTQHDNFGKGDLARAMFEDLLGTSMVFQDGASWFHQRKLASKFFTARMFREVATLQINKHTGKVMAVLEHARVSHQPMDLSKVIHEFTLQTIAELGFGLEMDLVGSEHGHPLNDALEEALPQILARAQTPEWLWKLQRFLNVGGERKYRDVTSAIRRMVSDMVHKSLHQSMTHVGPRPVPTTIVELLIHAKQDNEGDWITPEVLRDIGITFLLGGRDTTSDTLSWLFLMMSKHPEVEQKIRDELWRQVPELMDGTIKTLTMEQTQTLTYLDATIKETIRMYPPAPITQREAARDTHLVDGTFVPKGCRVEFATYVMGRLASVWGDDVHEFKPERFIDEQTGKLAHHSSFKCFGFSAGPRICIGKTLALLEVKLLVATLLSRYRLELAPNDGSYRLTANLSVKHPLMAHVRSAHTAAST